jgi:hypothetical protein
MGELIESGQNKTLSIFVCPYLGLAWDETIRYGYPNSLNYCYKPAKAASVSLKHQEFICLRGKYQECPVFSEDLSVYLPDGIRGEEANARRRKTRDKIIGISFLVVVLILFLASLFWVVNNRYYVKNLIYRNANVDLTPGVVSVAPLFNLFQEDTPIPSIAKDRQVFPTSTLNAHFSSTQTPHLVVQPSETPMIITQTPTMGPGLETPFGVLHTYLIHLVRTGETIEYIAALYKTSPAVLKKMNFLPYQISIWTDQPLVIQPGQTNLFQVSPMKAIKITQKTTVKEYITLNNLNELQFREINGLYDDSLTIGRWVIEPVGK